MAESHRSTEASLSANVPLGKLVHLVQKKKEGHCAEGCVCCIANDNSTNQIREVSNLEGPVSLTIQPANQSLPSFNQADPIFTLLMTRRLR